MSINIYVVNATEIDEAQINNMSDYRQNKYNSLKQESDKQLCLAAGVALDLALKGYGLSEQDMTYSVNEYGKPSLADYKDIHFSLSHSGDFAVCAIGDMPVGCDIEKIGRLDMTVANRYFSQNECEMLKSLSPDEQANELIRLWTIKESYAKLLGNAVASVLKSDLSDIDYNINTFYDINGYVLSCCTKDTNIELHIKKH